MHLVLSLALDPHHLSAPQWQDHLKVLAIKLDLLAVPVMVQLKHVKQHRNRLWQFQCVHIVSGGRGWGPPIRPDNMQTRFRTEVRVRAKAARGQLDLCTKPAKAAAQCSGYLIPHALMPQWDNCAPSTSTLRSALAHLDLVVTAFV